jgi:hypothetical protein
VSRALPIPLAKASESECRCQKSVLVNPGFASVL